MSDLAREGYNLRITCEGCAYVVDASAPLMMRELLRRHASEELDRLEQRLRCRRCGHRGARITATLATF